MNNAVINTIIVFGNKHYQKSTENSNRLTMTAVACKVNFFQTVYHFSVWKIQTFVKSTPRPTENR